MPPPSLEIRGVLHGLPHLVRHLYSFAGSTADWLDARLVPYRLIIFFLLLYLLYFFLSLPVRVLEVLTFVSRPAEGMAPEGLLRRLLRRQPERPASVRVSFALGRTVCFVALWWLLDRTMAFVF